MQKERQLTLIASIVHVLRSQRELATGYHVRETTEEDKSGLAELYFAAYTRNIVQNLAAARDEIEQTFTGEYGSLDLGASPVVVHGSLAVGSVLTVVEAPWHDTPKGPFIIEVMVHPDHRRLGVAEHMLKAVAQRLAAQDKTTMALRVMSTNTKALNLYRKLGFDPWKP